MAIQPIFGSRVTMVVAPASSRTSGGDGMSGLGYEDTIAAIATALGEASIAVIRVSGGDAFAVVDRVFRGRASLGETASHRVLYGRIVRLADGADVDEVLVTVMRGPRTYTTEDVVEIGTHGGVRVTEAVLREVLRAGARLAEPGEFTKRAFLGGRIDLAQAEGVMELIRAQTGLARTAALRQVEGSLTTAVSELRQVLLELMAHIEVTIDYPEHDEDEATGRMIVRRGTGLVAALDGLLGMAMGGRILRDGVRTAIVGKPNVGKSSLLNQLAGVERAIVTDIAGTTRDVIEETVQVGGVALCLMDTAGIRETDNVVEQIGVERSRAAMAAADLVLVVLDGSRPLDGTDRELLAGAVGRPAMVIVNKRDLPQVVSERDVAEACACARVLSYSALRRDDAARLADAVRDMVLSGAGLSADPTFVANARQIGLLEGARAALVRAVDAAGGGLTLDLVASDIRQAWMLLGEIIGETPREDLLDQIFRQFCLGK